MSPGQELPYSAWQETRETLHLWTQIVGKVRLALSSPINQWWHVPFYVTARGLTTSLIPYQGESGATLAGWDRESLERHEAVYKGDRP